MRTPLRVLSDGREKPGLFRTWPEALIFAALIICVLVLWTLVAWWIFS